MSNFKTMVRNEGEFWLKCYLGMTTIRQEICFKIE